MPSRKVNITLPSLDKLNLQVRLEGNWTKLDRLSDNLRSSVIAGYEQGIFIIGGRILKIVKKALTTGIPPSGSGVTWQPHSPATVKRWGAHPIYNLTGLYSNSISVKTYKSRTLVGIPYRSKKASQKGMTLNQLAILLEYGNISSGGNIPARPVWGPSLKAIGGNNAIKAELLKQIRRNLQMTAGINARQIK